MHAEGHPTQALTDVKVLLLFKILSEVCVHAPYKNTAYYH